MTGEQECFVSVDVETAGPIPGEYSLLSIGACSIANPELAFECELKPINANSVPEALEVTGLSLEDLSRTGLEPCEAMSRFADWISSLSGKPVFVGLNAPFDWSFVNYYFFRFLGDNPFGYTALDIKAFYLGKFGGAWGATKSSAMASHLRPELVGDHNALTDARYQAELFKLIRDSDERAN